MSDGGRLVEIGVAGVLFDMDGVLVKSTHGDERVWRRWAADHGLSETFDIRRTHGRRGLDTLQEYMPEASDEELAGRVAQLNRFGEEEQGGVEAYPGVLALIASIPDGRWTVVTSASEGTMRARLASCGITAPALTVGADSVRRGKPDPEGYLRGAEILGLAPGECLVVEDAPAGVRAGKAAGCRVLGVASSHDVTELGEADWVVGALELARVDFEGGELRVRFPGIGVP